MANFAIYINNPTAGAQDGTKISSDGSGTLPLTATLNATNNEEQVIKCAIRCNEGYVASDTTISFTGDTSDKWRVAEDNDYSSVDIAAQMCDWSSEITIASVTSTNKIFWAKASVGSDEMPSNDSSTIIQAEGITDKE